MKRPKRSNPVATAPNPVTTLSSPATIVFAYVFVVVGLIFLWVQPSSAQSVTGTTGLFSIPSARTMPDKTVSAGFYFYPGALSAYSRSIPNDNAIYHATVTFLPRLELMFRYTRHINLAKEIRKGLFMDRMMSMRIHLLDEKPNVPSVLVGFHDFGGIISASSNNYFGANYLVVSKSITFSRFSIDNSIGYGFDLKNDPSNTVDGFFGGMEIQLHQFEKVSWIMEFDSKRFNTAIKSEVGFLQCIAGVMGMKYLSGGCSVRVEL